MPSNEKIKRQVVDLLKIASIVIKRPDDPVIIAAFTLAITATDPLIIAAMFVSAHEVRYENKTISNERRN